MTATRSLLPLRRPPRRGPGAVPAGHGGHAAAPAAPRIPRPPARRDHRRRHLSRGRASTSSTTSSPAPTAASDEIDALIADRLAEGWTLERLDRPMRAILRAGAYELIARADVPAASVISEYVDVAHAFYDKRESGFVNGLLDAIAKEVRTGDACSADARARRHCPAAADRDRARGARPARRCRGARRPGPHPRQHRRRACISCPSIRPRASAGSWSRSI